MAFLSKLGRVLIGIGAVLLVLGGLVKGASLGAFLPMMMGGGMMPPSAGESAVGGVIGALIGAALGVLGAGIVFGPLATLYRINDTLAEIRDRLPSPSAPPPVS